MTDFPHCTVCLAPVSLRATHCAVCDAPAPPLKRNIPSGEIRSGEWVRFQRPPAELQELYSEVVRALAPDIRILGMAGEGGMALVFVGRDMVLKREVAVKILAPSLADDEVARKRFTREAEAIAAVSHPNIVNVYQVGQLPGRDIPYFVMQFVDGPTLGMGSLHGRMLTEARVRRLMADVAAGLAAAHRRKVFHRDIKPGNIVLDGETGRAMVLDFGISAAASSRRQSLSLRLTDEGMYLGTPTYMSPEQGGKDEITDRSDVYSLGILAFELLVGRPPFEGTPVAVMASHANEVPPRVDTLRGDVSPELAGLISRCLEKDPPSRPSAEDIANLLTPGAKQIVEWPPPGMSRVRAAGARLLSSVTGLSATVAVFFGVIGVRPQFALLRPAGSEPSLVNSFVLGASLAIISGIATMFLFYGVLALQRWRWAVVTGYPPWVVADLLSDARRDAGNLINGTGDFTLVPGPIRQKLLRLRRASLLTQVVGALVALVGIGRWVSVWLMSAGSDKAQAQTVAMHWAAPILAVFVTYMLMGIPEWRVRRAERGRASGVAGVDDAPPVRGELVSMWLASAEKARKSFTSRRKEDKIAPK